MQYVFSYAPHGRVNQGEKAEEATACTLRKDLNSQRLIEPLQVALPLLLADNDNLSHHWTVNLENSIAA